MQREISSKEVNQQEEKVVDEFIKLVRILKKGKYVDGFDRRIVIVDLLSYLIWIVEKEIDSDIFDMLVEWKKELDKV